MLSCEAIPDAVPGLSPSGRANGGPAVAHLAPGTDKRRCAGLTVTRNAQPALGIAGFVTPCGGDAP
ncbi:hypothetical protein GCM10010277_05150 [Streptomyces longisporoflavus]|nr:hypothetical protein GCM10010277_05150 [Streptomyces longisporoflavus]